MWSLQTFLILLFAFSGNTAVLIAYSYPAGFILAFLEERNANKIAGTIAISLCQISTVVSPYLVQRMPSFMAIDLKWRSLGLGLVSAACSASMAGIDFLSNTPALILMAISRTLLGAVLGIFFVIVQGEIVDRFMKDNKLGMVFIASGVYVGNTLGGILGTALIVNGGWTLAGPAIALFHILPLCFLPFIDTDGVEDYVEISGEEDLPNPTDSLNCIQHVAYYMPDFLFFMNNVGFSVLTFVVPVRMLSFMETPLETTVYELNIICTVVIIPGIAIAYLVSKKLDIIISILVWNIVFYCGSLLMFASTTTYASFYFEFEVSAVLVGLSDAIVTNLIIMSKFFMFERWKKDCTDLNLGQHASRVFNVSDSLGHIVGAVLSSFSMYRKGEIPTLTVFSVFAVLTSLSMIICKTS